MKFESIINNIFLLNPLIDIFFKSSKSKLLSRMAKMGRQMLPLSGAVIANIESDDDTVIFNHKLKF
jgi:hypothetical protein